MMIDRRNKRSVQIFFLLITFLVCSGVFFWYYSHPEDDVPDYFPPEVKEHQKTEREAALEKVRQLQQNGLENAAAETFYDDQSKKSISGNPDNSGYENARILFQKLNTTIVQESPLNENGEKMTADSFYDERLKQKQEEDKDFNQQKTSEEAENADHAVHPDPSVNEQHKQEAVQKTKTTSEKAESADPPVQPDPSANEQHKQETAQNSNTSEN
ncbi:hypothetical protein L3Y34_004420 [Caenorhabditis briggsae]|uniref:Conjugative transposon protein TraM n=1 Tax=Caenorhabditis briggsae TaxID=6238 RepID=A0AAE9D4M8_CAEBR|nr:hypothetical protein L3Y34_004420 [Caenorhabditis briggsae]